MHRLILWLLKDENWVWVLSIAIIITVVIMTIVFEGRYKTLINSL